MHNTTARVIRNTNLFEIYKNLLTREELTLTKQSALLKVAVILLNNSNSDARALGYRIIVLYSNYTLDYEPLYDVALNNGYIPIVKYLDSRDNFKKKVEENFFNAFYCPYN